MRKNKIGDVIIVKVSIAAIDENGDYICTHVREIFEHTYLVEADSSREAESICNAKSNGCRITDYTDTEYDSELIEDVDDLEGVFYDEL